MEILKEIRDNSSTTVHEGKSWFYAEYTNSILKRMLSLKPEAKHSWLGKYPVVARQNEKSSNSVDIYLDNDVRASARFFYDTFVEYVTRSKYKKTRHV